MTTKRMNLTLKVGLLVLLIAAVGGLYFANQKLSEKAKQTSVMKAEIEVGEQQIKAYELTKNKVAGLAYVDELADKVLPESENQSAVVSELTQFASRSRLKVVQISFEEGATVAKGGPKNVNVTAVSIELGAGGSYNDLLEFLRTLETNRRRSQVTDITIAPDVEKPDQLSQVTISLNLYTKKVAKAKL